MNLFTMVNFTRNCGTTHAVRNVRGPPSTQFTKTPIAWNHTFDLYYGGETAGFGVESNKDFIKFSIYAQGAQEESDKLVGESNTVSLASLVDGD